MEHLKGQRHFNGLVMYPWSKSRIMKLNKKEMDLTINDMSDINNCVFICPQH